MPDSSFCLSAEDMKERLSLTALKNIEKLPSFGYKLVPEHVETRSLYNEMQPGLEQVGRKRKVSVCASN